MAYFTVIDRDHGTDCGHFHRALSGAMDCARSANNIAHVSDHGHRRYLDPEVVRLIAGMELTTRRLRRQPRWVENYLDYTLVEKAAEELLEATRDTLHLIRAVDEEE
jgi:hypothetical protein